MNLTKPDSSVVQLAVDLACRAPSLHNSQPWRWNYADGRLQLFGDHRRLLRAADPTGRNCISVAAPHSITSEWACWGYVGVPTFTTKTAESPRIYLPR